MIADLFHVFLYGHIATGALGLGAFWIPVVTRKGRGTHVAGGRVFVSCMLATGSFAIGISTCTLLAPLATHPQLPMDTPVIRGIFGWMMLYLAVLTIDLAWYGRLCIRNRRDHRRNGAWHHVALQYLLLALAANCALQGLLLDQVLLVGMATIGIAASITNLAFIHHPRPSRIAWQLEHVKGLVGAGISVYTAFLAFGAVRLLPEAALSPLLWSAPLVVGLALIIGFQRRIVRLERQRAATNPAAPPVTNAVAAAGSVAALISATITGLRRA